MKPMKFEAYERAKQALIEAGNQIAPDREIRTRLLAIVTQYEDEGVLNWMEIIHALVTEIEFWTAHQVGGPRLVRTEKAA